MNTNSKFVRDYRLLEGSVRPICIEVFKSWDRVQNAFYAAFPGAFYKHEELLMKEWAAIASIPAELLVGFKFSGNMPDEDARRVSLMTEPMLARIETVRAGSVPQPKWAEVRTLRNLGQLEDLGRGVSESSARDAPGRLTPRSRELEQGSP